MGRGQLYDRLGFLAALILVTGLSSRLAPAPPVALAVELPGSPTEQLSAAAAALEAAMAQGGSGLTFEVVQRTTLYAKDGGPQIGVRDPADPATVVAEVDEFYVGAIVSRGAVTADAFWMEMRVGPDKTETPDFASSRLFSRVLELNGVLWRDDGDGWYQTDVSPGTGMDPVSARLLPNLLLSATDVDALQPELVDGRLLPGVRGIAAVDDYPGVVASDGKDFTEAAFEIRYWLDEAGRLVRLETSARNLGQTTYDLVSETVVTFGYGSTGEPPEPSPAMAPQQAPTSEPAPIEVGS